MIAMGIFADINKVNMRCMHPLLIVLALSSLLSADAFSLQKPPSKPRRWLMSPSQNQHFVKRNIKRLSKADNIKVNITSTEELETHWKDENKLFRNDKGSINYNALLRAVNVQGDTQIIGSREHSNYTHPVLQLMYHRKNNPQLNDQQKVSKHTDGCKIALAIEGGGMRGCISAGMVCAIHYLNLTDTIDVIYGSSAGTIIGAYLITSQVPWFGPEVYYDKLTTAGRQFIDTRRLLRAVGVGLLDPRLLRDVLMRPQDGKPVLNLNYLLQSTLQETKQLDWKTFVEKQSVRPLKIVTSGLKSEKAIVMDMDNGAFSNLAELANCMHASCLLPGIAGPLMNIDTRQLNTKKSTNKNDDTDAQVKDSNNRPKFIVKNNLQDLDYEPLADALVYEPLPFHSAVKEGATHVLVIRSRPDGTDVTGKGGFLEQMIFRRFFMRKNRLPRIYKYFTQQMHKKIYARDVLQLNDDAYSTRDFLDTSKGPHFMTIACPPGTPEVTRLETGREAIFEGLRRGFARAYDCLVEDPSLRGKGAEIAKKCFPDEILDYDPTTIEKSIDSAFEVYMQNNNVSPKAWTKDLTASESKKAEDKIDEVI